MKFIIAAFGARYSGMLLTNLESIASSNPTASVEVYWQDLPAGLIDQIKRAYPAVVAVSTCFNFSVNTLERISSKTLIWDFAAQRQPNGEQLVFVDSDTIVLRDLARFFDDEFDVAFTWKPEQFVLNTGVLLARGGERLSCFTAEWLRRTQHILQSPDLFALANSPTESYGGADQMALHLMLQYQRGTTKYRSAINGMLVDFSGHPCALLNETNSVPIATHTHIIHYKGGWQPILLDGAPFTRNRPRRDCHEMYSLYLETFQRARDRLNAAGPTEWSVSSLNIAVPAFSGLPPGVRRELAYVWHVLPRLPRIIARQTRRSANRWFGKARSAISG